MAMMRRRGAFSVLEVLIAFTIGLILWSAIMTMMRAEARMRDDVDERLTGENIPAVLHRHLSRDLSRVPLMKGEDAVKLTDGGHGLEITVQVAPARLEGRQLDLPVRTVRYRMAGPGSVIREEAGQRQALPVDGLTRLAFAREAAAGEGARDLLRVTGAAEVKAGTAAPGFSLAFPVGARKPGRVRWATLIRRDAR